MKRRDFILGLSFIPLLSCDLSKNTTLGTKETVKLLSEYNFYGVKILKMLKPDLPNKQFGLEQLETNYTRLLETNNKDNLILKAKEMIRNDFIHNNCTLIKGHLFSHLEVIIYGLSVAVNKV